MITQCQLANNTHDCTRLEIKFFGTLSSNVNRKWEWYLLCTMIESVECVKHSQDAVNVLTGTDLELSRRCQRGSNKKSCHIPCHMLKRRHVANSVRISGAPISKNNLLVGRDQVKID